MKQKEENKGPKQEDKGFFIQYPLELVYGCPELTRDDKWVLLAIMGECWSRGPHKLSYRDISKLSGVPISLLSSIKGKDGKPDKEGIIDRLARLGKIKVVFGKEIVSGKPKGNAQTFIYIEYDQIWQDNAAYCEANKPNRGKEHYRCDVDSCQPVSYTNAFGSETTEPVRHTNGPVSYTNTSVRHTNGPVSYTNTSVRHTNGFELENGPNNIKITNNLKDKEDSIPNKPATSAIVANATTPSVSSSKKLEQESSLIVIEATPKSKSTESKTTRNHQSLEQPHLLDATPTSPVMPPEAAKWCAETVVQIVEFRRNKRFLEDARGKTQKPQRERQLDAAKKIIAAKITREEFIKAYDARNDAWWQENQGELTVVEMAANTKNKVMRTLEVLETLEKRNSKAPQQKTVARSTHGTASNDSYTKEERMALMKMSQEQRKAYNQKRREERERNAIANGLATVNQYV